MSGTRRKPGGTGPFVLGFQSSSLEPGHSALAIPNILKDVGAVGRRMPERDLPPDQLAPAMIALFRMDCLAQGRREIPSIKSFEPLLRFLWIEGVIAEAPGTRVAGGRQEPVEYRQPVEVAVRDADGGGGAVVQCDPVGQGASLGGGAEGVDEDGVILAVDQGGGDRGPTQRRPEGAGRSPTTVCSERRTR